MFLFLCKFYLKIFLMFTKKGEATLNAAFTFVKSF